MSDPGDVDNDASDRGFGVLDELRLTRALTILLVLAAAVVVIAGLRAFASSLGPVFLALVLVVVVRPVQRWSDQRGLPGWVGAVGLIGAAYGILVVIALSLAWSATQLASHLRSGTYNAQIADLQRSAADRLSEFGITGADLQDVIDQLDIGAVAGQVVSAASGVLGVGSLLSLLVITMLFMAADSSRFIDHLESSVTADRPDVVSAFQGFAASTRSYFAVSTVFGLVVAVLDVVALVILGIPLALVWGVLSLITNYIPNIGFVLGVIPPALLALLEGGWQLAVIVVVVYFAINTVIQTVIQPRFVGDAVGLSATLTFLSLVFWGWVFGPLGALLAVPMSLFVKALLVDIDPATRWAAPLISLDNRR